MLEELILSPNNLGIPTRISALEELAYNLRWTWNSQVQSIFEYINPSHWETYRNPIQLLRETASDRLDALVGEPDFIRKIQSARDELQQALSQQTWFDAAHATDKDKPIIYICAEFGLHECLKIYSGGLGVLAGDHAKAASDLGLPFIGIGLLYKNGYFIQEIDAQGEQKSIYPHHDFSNLPVQRVLDSDGGELRINVDIAGEDVAVQAWVAIIGRTKLLLLDTDLEENSARGREITSQLYGGDREMRISQEIILGIGGVRLVDKLGIPAAVWHMNEGHVAFSAIERMRMLMHRKKIGFAEAREAVTASTVFTTHTPVPAGNEAFVLPLIDKYFRKYCNDANMPLEHILELGFQKGAGGEIFFSMTVFALRFSARTNGVSQLHGVVSEKMWAHIWPNVPTFENPISGITNGIHTKTWIGTEMASLYDQELGIDWPEHLRDQSYWEKVRDIDDDRLQAAKQRQKVRFIQFVRAELKKQYKRQQASESIIQDIDNWLDPNVLTIGFARRFASYKRATLLFRDWDRFLNILNNSERPVQFVFSGKAHPADKIGQGLIQDIWKISQNPAARGKVIMLENYNMHSGRHLVQGVDVWLNNPKRPQEASGTSGQKVPPNGGINASILDGWWPEAYNGDNGWEIGEAKDYHNVEHQNYEDAQSLYHTLENKIIPLYYGEKTHDGRNWASFIKESIMTITPVFNTEVMVKNYYETMYKDALAFGETFANDAALPAKRASAKSRIKNNWPYVHFTRLHSSIDRSGEKPYVDLDVELYAGGLNQEDLTVELYSDSPKGSPVVLQFQKTNEGGHCHSFTLKATIDINIDATFQVRVFPQYEGLFHKQELGLMLWRVLD